MGLETYAMWRLASLVWAIRFKGVFDERQQQIHIYLSAAVTALKQLQIQ